MPLQMPPRTLPGDLLSSANAAAPPAIWELCQGTPELRVAALLGGVHMFSVEQQKPPQERRPGMPDLADELYDSFDVLRKRCEPGAKPHAHLPLRSASRTA